MTYYNKYLKYKNKYSKLKNMQGGVNKQLPFLLYIIGEETGGISQRSYLCTFLYQIEFIRKYTNITNDRIHLIIGKNGSSDIIQTCEHPKAGLMKDKPIPYGIDITYIDDSYDTLYCEQVIRNILSKKIEANTPIIFIYDGHGFTTPTLQNEEGDMLISDNLFLTKNIFNNIFKPYDANKKLLIFTQCGSFGFYTNLTNLPNKLANTVYICATNGLGQCGLGAGVLIKLSELININPPKYLNFKDIITDLGNYHLEDSTQIKVSDILIKYQGAIKTFGVGDKIVLKTNNNMYLSYKLPDTVRKPIIQTTITSPNTYKWIIEILPNNNIKFKTENTYFSTHTNSQEYAYLDIYGGTGDPLYSWNNNDRPTQKFKINPDNSISPIEKPDMYLVYNPINGIFTHSPNNDPNNDPNNLVKIEKA
jgi:hypothetical protein